MQSMNGSFESSFLKNFIVMDTLGKGGFGVVFKARHKIDDNVYAIKQILLPFSEESRKKVIREVKALARLNQLDHPNIVRYYNSWIESTPAICMEDQDQLWDTKSSIDEDQLMLDERENNVENINPLYLQSRSSFSQASKKHKVSDDGSSFIRFQQTPSFKMSVSSVSSNIEDQLMPDSVGGNVENLNLLNLQSRSSFAIASRKRKPPREENHKGIKKMWDSAVGSDNSMDNQSSKPSKMYLFIQMALCKEKNLKDWLRDEIRTRHTDYMRFKVINMFEQIVEAVQYIHEQGLIHRDLKPSNIFFSHNRDQLKVGDFGLVADMVKNGGCGDARLAAKAERSHTAGVGTELYMSPELISVEPGNKYSFKVDIYALGVILFELLVPFNTEMERIQTLTNLKKNEYPKDFQTQFEKEFELLKMMLSHNPKARPETSDILPRLHIMGHNPCSPTGSKRKSISQSLE